MEKPCSICGVSFSEELPKSGDDILCRRCKEIVDLNKKKKNFNSREVKKALKKASFIDPTGNHHFLCYYTGVPCDVETGFKSDNSGLWHAFDLTFDHLNPSYGYGIKGEELAVCLNIVNQIKSNIPASVFKEFLILLAKKFEQENSSKYDPDFKHQLSDLLYARHSK
ncbi:hypothetical protein [Methanolobus chelungpuianus]|uniref:Uncharacterized protein n=1 Tax=Methanolobus chelungpuianus TaxID=502115 RepID=A0AAE3KY68_9EURY|nr:hypothetical protein [Methanolobus chelungpuianus]MCQ6963680.1 hypothetical protein [Methanolobus chelungpuianus]